MATMETELRSVAKVTAVSSAALYFCYVTLRRLPTGSPRLLALLPIICLFTVLPLTFSSIQLRTTTAFFLVWLASFKLVLLAFQKGPVAAPGISFPVFLALSAFPVKIEDQDGETHKKAKEEKAPPSSPKKQQDPTTLALDSLVGSAFKAALLAYIISHYRHRNRYPRSLVIGLYGLHLYLSLDLVLRAAALVSRTLIGRQMVLEPQFAPPYLSTSLQDFWSRRWNLMVTRLLRLSVYVPIRIRWGPLAGVISSFLVSGLMHEVMFYYLTLQPPTGEVTCFFLLHGLSVAAEVYLKAALRRRGWKPLPRVIAAPLTVGYVFVTGMVLFFPPITRCDAEETVVRECLAMLEFGQRLSGRGLDLLRHRRP